MVEDAKVAIIGGGIAGCSLAYHLTKLGWEDVVLLEQAELTAGSTWHAAGLCTQFNSSYNVMGLLRDSVELYQRLEAETGQAGGYPPCGSVRPPATEERVRGVPQPAGGGGGGRGARGGRGLVGLERELPVLRDADASYYVRQEGDALLIGPFERNPKPWAVDGIPDGFHGKLLPPDLDQIEEPLAAAAERLPVFADAGIRSVVNGPDAYTPDGRCLMGPVPGLRDFHVLAGFSIFGIVFAGGAGRFAAEWIVDGQPSVNMWDLDVRRFGGYATSAPYLVPPACPTYERENAIH